MAVNQLSQPTAQEELPVAESLLKVFWRRYRRNAMALVGLVLVIIFVILAIFAPVIAPYH